MTDKLRADLKKEMCKFFDKKKNDLKKKNGTINYSYEVIDERIYAAVEIVPAQSFAIEYFETQKDNEVLKGEVRWFFYAGNVYSTYGMKTCFTQISYFSELKSFDKEYDTFADLIYSIRSDY